MQGTNYKKTYGVITLLFVLPLLGIGMLIIESDSYFWHLVYIAGCLSGAGLIIATYCTRCNCRANCNHILPGRLASLLPKPKSETYTPATYSIVALSLMFIVLFPLLWAHHHLFMVMVFLIGWSLNYLIIRFKICSGCLNRRCPLARNAQNS